MKNVLLWLVDVFLFPFSFLPLWNVWMTAEVETRLRNFSSARDAFSRAVNGKTDDPRLWLAYGRMELLAGNNKEAEQLLERACLGEKAKEKQLSHRRDAK